MMCLGGRVCIAAGAALTRRNTSRTSDRNMNDGDAETLVVSRLLQRKPRVSRSSAEPERTVSGSRPNDQERTL